MNDEAMLCWAGTGVAMVNGDRRIKDIADLITDRSNDDDGVADVIERCLAGKPAAPETMSPPPQETPGQAGGQG
jgi:hypothetical protein